MPDSDDVRETAEVMADPDTLRALAEARDSMARGEIYTTEQIRADLAARQGHMAQPPLAF